MHFAAAGCHSAFELQSGEANNEGISSVFVDKGHLTNATITIAQIKVIPRRRMQQSRRGIIAGDHEGRRGKEGGNGAELCAKVVAAAAA